MSRAPAYLGQACLGPALAVAPQADNIVIEGEDCNYLLQANA